MHPTRVLSSGGMFSNPKVNYSKDTHDFVNVLMKEAHLTNIQKDGFQSILRSGDSLPTDSNEMMKRRFQEKRRAMGKALGLPQQSEQQNAVRSRHNKSNRCKSYPPLSGRRTLDQIKASGAFEPTPQRPFVGALVNSKEQEIARLQHIMTYGKNKPTDTMLLNQQKPKEKREKPAEEEKNSRYTELVDEIGDRIEFLSSMNEIGRDKVYRSMIEYQIREKLNELEKNHPNDVQSVVEHFGLQKFMNKIEL